MKKKITLLLLSMITCLSLTSCDLFNTGETVTTSPDAITTQIETSYSKIYDEVKTSCIAIRCLISDTTGSIGSGVVIKQKDGYSYAITNNHVIEGAMTSTKQKPVNAYFGGSLYVSSTVLFRDKDVDLALISFKTPSSKTVTVAEIGDDIPNIGEQCLSIGCPIELQYYNYLTIGNVSGLNLSYVQHCCPINPGNSGGALFNLSGRLIGINVQKIVSNKGTSVEGMSYAIRMRILGKFLSDNNFSLTDEG